MTNYGVTKTWGACGARAERFSYTVIPDREGFSTRRKILLYVCYEEGRSPKRVANVQQNFTNEEKIRTRRYFNLRVTIVVFRWKGNFIFSQIYIFYSRNLNTNIFFKKLNSFLFECTRFKFECTLNFFEQNRSEKTLFGLNIPCNSRQICDGFWKKLFCNILNLSSTNVLQLLSLFSENCLFTCFKIRVRYGTVHLKTYSIFDRTMIFLIFQNYWYGTLDLTKEVINLLSYGRWFQKFLNKNHLP